MDEAIGHYPAGQKRSAAMPLMHLWQEHFGFISDEGVSWIAARLGLEPINILELLTFYPMFRQAPAGRKHIRVCRTLSCAMAGAYSLREKLASLTNIDHTSHGGEGMHPPLSVSADGEYSIEFVECLASCGTAPVCMVDDALLERVAPDHLSAVPAVHDSRFTIPAALPPPSRAPPHFSKHWARRLHHRDRLLPAKRRLRTAQGGRQNESGRDRERGQEFRPTWPRRRRFPLWREMELHQTG